MKKQFKFLPLAQLKMIEEGPGGFEGYRSVFGELDDAGDIVLPGAYDKFLEQYLTRGFTADTHEWSYGGLIGYPVKANTDDYGLFVASEFHSTEDAQAVRTKIKERMAAGKGVFCSIGYWPWGVKVLYPGQYATELPKVVKADKLQDALARSKQFAKIRLLSEIELAEDSVVPVPALRSAEATEAKGEARGERPEARGQRREAKGATGAMDLPLADRDRAWSKSEADTRVREWAGAEDAPNAKYRKAFFWYDESASENFGSYKMMFADVIDGTLTAIPRGIFSCAGVMNGARGGVDIPDDDREAVMSRIARYYERMREAFDDDSIQMPGMEEDKMGDGCRVTGVRERLAELKAQYLGPHAEGDMTWAALRDLTDTLFWYVVADVLFSSDAPLVEKIDFLRSAFDEYRDIAIRVIESLMGAMEPMEEAEAALKAVFRDPKEVSLSALAAESFETQIGTALAAVETVTARGKVILALRARDGRTLSGERKKRLAEVRAAIDALTETVATRASRPDLAQVILREAEALERAALYGG